MRKSSPANKELFDIKGTFYYDETDNVRKYYLKETGLNEQIDKHFVLGGAYLEEGWKAYFGLRSFAYVSNNLHTNVSNIGDISNCFLVYFFTHLIIKALMVNCVPIDT